MKNYESYTTMDFVQDEEFRDWVQGNSQHELFWMTFLQTFPAKSDAIRQAEHLIRAAQVAPEQISEKEIRNEVEFFIERAGKITTPDQSADDQQPNNEYKSLKKILRYGMSIAAMVLLAIGISWYSSQTANFITPSDSPQHTDLVRTSNNTNKPLRILLIDGSEVILSPKSYLNYPSQFADSSRIVYLEGEASFSIKRQGQPFMVYTGDVVTRVLGTRFVVKAFEKDKNITVQVQSGKVSVYVTKPDHLSNKKGVKGLIITANQEAIFEKSISQLSKTVVENPAKLTNEPIQRIFQYEEIPLPVILHELEKTYGIPVQFDAQNFQACKITATLSNESLYEKLDILCKAVTANYEIVDGQIVLSGKGCR